MDINVVKYFFINLDKQTAIKLIIAIGIIAVLSLLSPLFSYVVIKVFNFKSEKDSIKKNALYLPLKSFFKLLGIYLAIIFLRPVLKINVNLMNYINKLFRILVIITTSIGLSNSLQSYLKIVKKIRGKSEREFEESTVKLTVRLIRFLIYAVAVFMIVADLGYDLSGLVTGLGLGSVVITLAAQDTIKNLFGGFIIFLDKPFKIGDFIQFDTYLGTVEDINFRSTKIRTLENSIAQIPNAEISSTTVININKIKNRRFQLDLGFVLKSNLKDIMKFKYDLLKYLENSEYVTRESANVFLNDIKTNGYNLFIYCYLNVSDYVDFLQIKEEINLNIMKLVEKHKLELAYDTKTIEIKK